MCWVGKEVECIAEKDIVTFKLLNIHKKELRSYYRSFLYKLNTLYETRLEKQISNNDTIEISEGFHSYDIKCLVDKSYGLYGVFSAKEGEKDWYIESVSTPDVVFVKSIIPKGSIYFRNIDGEIVSNKIIIKELLKVVVTDQPSEVISSKSIGD